MILLLYNHKIAIYIHLFCAIAICFYSCGDALITIEEVENIDIDNCALFSQDAYIINDSITYNALLAEMLNTPECIGLNMPSIDFQEKTLLGKLTAVNAVCSVNYEREVFADSDHKEYLYKITITKQSGCTNNFASMNWITVPKMPADYNVVYEIIN